MVVSFRSSQEELKK
jgi:hypothetical protein